MRLNKRTLKFLSCITAVLIAISFVFPFFQTQKAEVEAATVSASQAYVNAMGHGWNLGNSFDSFNTAGDQGETSWGNPLVTKELLKSIKAQGFDSIRIPFTAYTRIGDASSGYAINSTYLNRYEEVVKWALDEGFYVMINIHHDSGEWLANWNGSTTSTEYVTYVKLWEQLANRFKGYGDHLMFESINEPTFKNIDGVTALTAINNAFYNVVRNSGGNNATRMLVVPTLYTNDGQQYCTALYNQIIGWNDKNIIATFHYYSEWVFSANLGKTRFDEVLWDSTTARTSMEAAFNRIYNTFGANGIGVICGEYGLQSISLDKYAIEDGEGLKYFEYANYLASQKGICLMLWDNGEFFDRTNLVWKDASLATMWKTSMKARSSYATGLDMLFVTGSKRWTDISIPLTLNGNSLVGIYSGTTQLVQGTDYTYANGVVTLKGNYIGNKISGSFGLKDTLRFVFSGGTDWYQYLYYSSTPSMSQVTGTTSSFSIPVNFKGDFLEKVTSKDASGNIVSNNTWWNYLQYGYEFTPNYTSNVISLPSSYFTKASGGTYTLSCTYYSGKTIDYSITVSGTTVTGRQITAATADEALAEKPTTSPTPSPSVAPTATPTVAPTATPTAAPTATPTAAPTVTPTAAPTVTPGAGSNVTYSLKLESDWGSGCIANLAITNTTGTSFTNGWKLQFDFPREVTTVWGGNLLSSSNGHYVVTNPDWDGTWDKGETLTIRFMAGTGSSTATVSNVVLANK